MVNYSASAVALLALASLAAHTISAKNSDSLLNDGDNRHGLRKLLSEGHEITDMQTQCDRLVTGNPKVCNVVCVEVTSIIIDDITVEEYSQVSQHDCESGWEKDVGWKGDTTEWGDDGHDERIVDLAGDKPSTILSGGSNGSKNGRSKGSNDGHSKSSKSKGSKGGGYYKYGGYWSSGSSEDEATDHGDGSVGHGYDGTDVTQVRASLADVTQLRAEIDKLISDSERELIPKFLRLGFHDCVSVCDGCVDLTNPENAGLQEPIDAIYTIVEKYKDTFSRADVWAMATLVSADASLVSGRPNGIAFPMNYVGRQDCDGASPKGEGGPDVTMPSPDSTTHELLNFFKTDFGFSVEETVAIMGVHAVAVAHRENVGFGNLGKEEGWVYEAEEYILDNRYYGMLVQPELHGTATWQLELVHNNNSIPSRYQWFFEKDGEEERPIMTNADMALVRDCSDHMHVDKDGNMGAVNCTYSEMKARELGMPSCPVAVDTIGKMMEYQLDNEMFLYDFEKVLEKMVGNGYPESALYRVNH